MNLFAKKELIGVDIGASAIKIIQLRNLKNQYELVQLALTKLPSEVITEDEIKKPDIIADYIKRTFTEHKITEKNVATSISGRSVIVKKIKLPKMMEEELEESIQWEAEQFIPFDIHDVSLDFQIMSDKKSEEDNMDVLLVAVKKDRIADIINIIELAGLKPAVIDIDAFALENQYEANYSPVSMNCEALLDIGAETLCINVLKNGASVFTRDAAVGINHLHRSIQKEMLLDFAQSEAILNGRDVEGRGKGEAMPFIDGFLEEVIAEVQRSFDYFRATAEEGTIDNILISGGGALMNEIPPFINKKLGIPIQRINPFKNIKIDSKKFDPDYISSIAPLMAVSVGLALRRIGDR